MRKLRALIERAKAKNACWSATEKLARFESYESLKEDSDAIFWLNWASDYDLIPKEFSIAYEAVQEEALCVYRDACAPLKAQYNADVAPHWQAYHAQFEGYEVVYREKIVPLWDAYQATCRPHSDAYNVTVKTAAKIALDGAQAWIESQE